MQMETDEVGSSRRSAVSHDLRTPQASITGGEEVHLTPNEYKLLRVPINHAAPIVTHRQWLSECWAAASEQSQYLRLHVAQLRRTLERDPAHPRHRRPTRAWDTVRFLMPTPQTWS